VDESRIHITNYLGTFSTEFNGSEQDSHSHTVSVTFQAESDGDEIGFDDDHSMAGGSPLMGVFQRTLTGLTNTRST
jgi:hypothetical protein